MKENSPICASAAETVNAVLKGYPNSTTITSAARDLPNRMMASTAATISGFVTRMAGSNSMPTEMKKSTANASCSGSELAAALWLSSDSFKTTPAKNAPKANETPNNRADANAMPSATASTHKVNSSREPVRATCRSNHGITRGPSTKAKTTKELTFNKVSPKLASNPR